tara:strand:+ start:165 stop:317 length:153 start_codon:yes stop_codon:yes gene_type:complete
MLIEGDIVELGIIGLIVLSIIEISFWVYVCTKISKKLSTIMIGRDRDESR